mgnify:CR=1 FL=1
MEGLIQEYRGKSIEVLGEKIFNQVYDLCAEYMLVDFDAESNSNEEKKSEAALASSTLLSSLERTICDHLHAGIDVACEVVFNVKLLLALESRLEEQR